MSRFYWNLSCESIYVVFFSITCDFTFWALKINCQKKRITEIPVITKKIKVKNYYKGMYDLVFIFFYMHIKNTGFTKIFKICFSNVFLVLRCPEHGLTIFRKCLSVGLAFYMSLKFYGHCILGTNAWKLMKLYIQFHLDVIWCWLDFGTYRSKGDDVARNFWFH